jgi:tRNA threonylcarbamoyladenosine biosynthesis protein TsaE
MKIYSEQEMLDFGEKYAKSILSMNNIQQNSSEAKAIELVGDVGAGKTTFVRGLAKGLGIKESVTSPSFTISKIYAMNNGGNLVHYDFYRLSDPGLMSDDLQENLSNPKNIVVIEWGESIVNLLPDNRIQITIIYNDDDTRSVKSTIS